MLVTKPNGQMLAGTIWLRAGHIRVQAEKGFEILMDNMLTEPIRVLGKELTAERNAEDWFYALPKVYDGSHLRAKLVAE